MGRLLDEDNVIDTITEYGWGDNVYMSVGNLMGRIEQLPPAQPELIRCKDCKYSEHRRAEAVTSPLLTEKWKRQHMRGEQDD